MFDSYSNLPLLFPELGNLYTAPVDYAGNTLVVRQDKNDGLQCERLAHCGVSVSLTVV